MEKIKANIFGASGHAMVIIDIIHSKSGIIEQIFDDDPAIKNLLDYEVTHDTSGKELKESAIVVAVGNNSTRKKIVHKVQGKFHPYISHISAVVSDSAQVGEGSVIMANASVNSGAVIGKHCIVNTGAVVEHQVVLENFVHISPNASIAGNVHIGEGAHVGIGVAVIPGIKIGKWATVGAGAVIIEDIPDFATVVGNPGKVIKYNENIDESE